MISIKQWTEVSWSSILEHRELEINVSACYMEGRTKSHLDLDLDSDFYLSFD